MGAFRIGVGDRERIKYIAPVDGFIVTDGAYKPVNIDNVNVLEL
jgi:hypothetical protein